MRAALPILTLLLLITTASNADAQRRRHTWDNKGWVMLGEQTVDHGRRADRDTFVVGRYEGRYTKLQMVVDDSDLELLDFAVTFGPRGEVWRPAGVGHYFRENQATRVIDLPGDDRIIQKIDVKYKNLPGGGRARVQIWGFKAAPVVAVVRRHVWDTNGWQMLGEQTVDHGRRADRDTIVVGRYEGRFSKLQMVVDDSDLELLDFAVTFGPRGEVWRPAGVGHYFRENQRTRVIDLPGDDRIIQKIDLTYKNLPGGGRARVQVWGLKQVGRPAPVVVRRHVWDTNGWQMLGEQTVDHGRRADRDTIVVGRYEGRFSKLTMVVDDSDLELLDFAVTFGPRGEVWRPAGVGHYFRENQRTRVIDLPGDDRIIQKIDLAYKNLPGGGRARVQIWGFKTTGVAVRPVVVSRKAVWNNTGWVKLGEQTVDHGRRADRDTIVVGRYEGRFSKLTMVVDDDDLELLDFAVTFGPRGEVWRPAAVGHYFRENQRTRVIDLPGDTRVIQKIDLAYRNLPGGGRARVEIWGFKR